MLRSTEGRDITALEVPSIYDDGIKNLQPMGGIVGHGVGLGLII